MPATSEQLILAMNNGKPMAPKLMYEFPRAAMNVELKRGAAPSAAFSTPPMASAQWTRAALHDWLMRSVARLRDRHQPRHAAAGFSWAHLPHLLVLGCARIGGTDYRFKLYARTATAMRAIAPGAGRPDLPVLFKPMGSPCRSRATSPRTPTMSITSPS
jgi:hypothetical protein